MDLADELMRLPAQPLSASRILAMAENPDASTADLARIVEADPILSAQVMRLANSAYYGLSGTVGHAGRAVILLGFSTVRALAVTAVCSMIRQPGDTFADGYWPHAVATAMGARAVARRASVPVGDAFSAGLLHDIGAALLRRRDPQGYEHLLDVARGDRARLGELEAATYGVTHPEAGAAVLQSWGLPAALVRAVREHHRPVVEAHGSLTRVVIAGEALAQHLHDTFPYEPGVDLDAALAAVGLRTVRPRELLDEMRGEIAVLGRELHIAA